MVRIVVREETSGGAHAYELEICMFLILPLAPFDYMTNIRVRMSFEYECAPLSNDRGA